MDSTLALAITRAYLEEIMAQEKSKAATTDEVKQEVKQETKKIVRRTRKTAMESK